MLPPLRIVKGHVLSHDAVDLACPELAAIDETGVARFVGARVRPRDLVLEYEPIPGPAQQWVPLSQVHAVPVSVALRITACVIKSVLHIHASGGAHRFIDPNAVFVKQGALDAAMRAVAPTRTSGAVNAAAHDGGVDATVPDVVLGRYPMTLPISCRALAGPLRSSFGSVAPELTLAPPSTDAGEGAALNARPVTGSKSLRRANAFAAEGLPAIGRAADVWGVAAVLSNLLADAPLTTADLVDCAVDTPWLRQQDPAIVALLVQCLACDPDRRPTIATLATHPAFGGKRESLGTVRETAGIARPALSAESLIEQLRRRKRVLAETPENSPTKVRTLAAAAHDDEDDEDDEDDSDANESSAETEESEASSTSDEGDSDDDDDDDV